MRRRQKIGDSGMAIVDGVYDSQSGSSLRELQMETFGIPPLAKSDDWDKESTEKN